MGGNRGAIREVGLCFAVIVAIKCAAMLVDPTLRLFLGDSASYLHAAATDWTPPDRSFVYPYIVRMAGFIAESELALVAIQSLFGALSATLLFAMLRHTWRCSFRLALAAAVTLSIEPGQLFYERMLMAEAAGHLAFVLQLCCVLQYARHGRVLWLPIAVLFGVLTIAFRLSLLPTVLALGAIAPVARVVGLRSQRRLDAGEWAHAALAMLVVLVSTGMLHAKYRDWASTLSGTHASGYIARTGSMRLGLVAPLVEAEHLQQAGVDPALLAQVSVPLQDPRAREAQIWADGGIVDVLYRHTADPERAARKISIRAARDDPFGIVALGSSTLLDYFDRSVAWPRLQDDVGRRELPAGTLKQLRDMFGYDAALVPQQSGPVTRWFELGAGWLTFCLFAIVPLSLTMLVVRWRETATRAPTVLLALTGMGLFANQWLFSHIVSFRYLHPMPWLVIAAVVLIIGHMRPYAPSNQR